MASAAESDADSSLTAATREKSSVEPPKQPWAAALLPDAAAEKRSSEGDDAAGPREACEARALDEEQDKASWRSLVEVEVEVISFAGETIEKMRLPRSGPVLRIKERIHELRGIAVSAQRLVLDTTQLYDETPMAVLPRPCARVTLLVQNFVAAWSVRLLHLAEDEGRPPFFLFSERAAWRATETI